MHRDTLLHPWGWEFCVALALQLVETIARHFATPHDPLQHYTALERAIASSWLLSTSEV